MMENQFEKLKTWKEAHSFVLNIYKILEKLPNSEKYNIINQVRRSSVSIAANIAEGNIRNSYKEFMQFMYIAKGSLEETKYYLLLVKDLNYITKDEYQKLMLQAIDCGKLISGFLKFLRFKVESRNSI